MKCDLCVVVGNKATTSSEECFLALLDQIKLHYVALQKKSNVNDIRLHSLEDLNSDYKKQLDDLVTQNDSLKLQIRNNRTPKKRKKTTSMDIEDDEDALTDNDLNVAVHSPNLFGDSSVQALSPRNSSAANIDISRSSKTPTKSNINREPFNIFNITPKKTTPPVQEKSTEFKTPSKLDTSASKTKRVLALYSPKNKKILVSPAKSKDLPKRIPISSGWKSRRTSSTTNLKSSMSFISNSNNNKENKSLIQSRLVFPRNEGSSLILDSEEETFCEEIQSSQKSPGPRHNKSKRLKKPANSIVKCLSTNFFNPAPSPKKSSDVVSMKEPETVPEEAPVTVKQELEEDDASGDLEIIDEDESYNIKSMDLLAELMNQEGTENLHYMKSLSDAAAKKIQKRNEARTTRCLSLKSNSKSPEAVISTSTPKPDTKKFSTPFLNPVLLKVKEEPIDQSMDTTDDAWNEFEDNDFDEVQDKKTPVIMNKRKCPEVLEKNVEFKKRTYKDCPDCMQFIREYGKELSKEVIDNRIEKCTRHNRMDEDPNMTPEGFWDPFMTSLPPDDRRREVFVDDRLLKKK